MQRLRFRVVDAEGLVPFQKGLQELEQSISYPVDDGADAFSIDHGPRYSDFFCRMGKARFLVVLEGERVVGSLVGVWREANFGGKRCTGLYFCDLKLHRSVRGRGVPARILWYVLQRWPVRRDFQGWRFVYFAAMQGDGGGDVARSFQGWHLGKIVTPVSVQWLYFVPSEQLAALPEGGPSAPERRGLDFSPDNTQLTESTHGRKDLRLHSTGEPWPLVHVPCGPDSWNVSLGTHLQRAGKRMLIEQPGSLACFGLDERLQEHTSWLESQGIQRGARCVIYGFSIPGWAPRMGTWSWAHLATSEI